MWGLISHFQTISLTGNMKHASRNRDCLKWRFHGNCFFGSKEISSDSSNGFPQIASQILTNPEVDDRSERIEESCEFLLRLLELLDGDNIKKRQPWQC